MAGYARVRPSGHWLDFPDTTYGVVGAADFEQWDQTIYNLRHVVRYISDYTGVNPGAQLANAIADLPSTGGRVIVDTSGPLTTTIVVTTPDTVIDILPGVTLTKAANGNMIRLHASRAAIIGQGVLDGAQASGYTGACVSIANAADSPLVSGVRISNAAAYGIYAVNCTRAKVLGATFSGNGTNAIYGELGAVQTLVEGNAITHAGTASAVSFHSTTAGKSVSGTRVINNDIEGPFQQIDVGAYSGDVPTGVQISGNRMKQAVAGSTVGGISFGSVTDSAIGPNTYDANGLGAGGLGYELNGCKAVSVSGGEISGDTTLNTGVTLERCVGCSVTGIVINGFSTTPSGTSGYGFKLVADATSSTVNGKNCNDNILSDYIVTMPATGAVTGVLLVSTADAAANVNYNKISGKVIGNSVAGSVGVKLSNAAGTLDGTFIEGCSNRNVTTAISRTGDTNTTLGTNQ